MLPTAKAAAPQMIVYSYPADICKNEINQASTSVSYQGQQYDETKESNQDNWINFLKSSPVLYDLAKCESGFNPKAEGDLHLKESSKSLFQYQPKTWLLYSKKYNIYPTGTTDQYILDDIYNVEKQILLTGLVLSKEPDGWRNWLNCSKKIGLPGRL